MTKQILTIVYEGVAEWEVVFPLFCIYPSVTYEFAAVKEKKVRGAMGFELEAKYTLNNVNSEEFHAIFIPGGIDPQENRFPRKLRENKILSSLLKHFAHNGKVVAAICGAPLLLGAAGLLKGKQFVCDITEDTRQWLDDGQRMDDLYVVNGLILTGSVRGLIPFSMLLHLY